jgi:V8-like Glu-specific endopeptidase
MPDNRKEIVDAHMRYPYKCIGKLLAYFKGNEVPFQGTAFLIGKNLLATVAHNLLNRSN